MLPRVEVLMSAYNGENYIGEQIWSILNQTNVDVHLTIRDDGSSDGTISIIHQFVKQYPERISFRRGTNLGPAKSFMQLVISAGDAQYYAFADQDDIWSPDKLETAVSAIKAKEETPGAFVMYHSAVAVADSNGNVLLVSGQYHDLGFLRGDTRPATGCTMVFNAALQTLLRRYMPEDMIMHDAWVHKVCLAVGGHVVFDEVPHIRYRQHGNNVVGGRQGFIASTKRRIKYLKNLKKKQYSSMYAEILEVYHRWMPEENIDRCRKLCDYDKSFKNTIAVLLDRDYFKGRFHWKWTNILLVLLKRY